MHAAEEHWFKHLRNVQETDLRSELKIPGILSSEMQSSSAGVLIQDVFQ